MLIINTNKANTIQTIPEAIQLKLKIVSICIFLTLMLAFVASPIDVYGFQSPFDSYEYKITLSSGKVESVTKLKTHNAIYEADNYSFSNVSFYAITSLTRRENSADTDTFMLSSSYHEKPIQLRVAKANKNSSEEPSISGAGEWGDVSIPFSRIKSITPVLPKQKKQDQAGEKQESATSFTYPHTWKVEISGGTVFQVHQIVGSSSGKINGELGIKHLKWWEFTKITSSSAGLDLHLPNNDVWRFKGQLTLGTPFASVALDLKDIKKIEYLKSAAKTSPAESGSGKQTGQVHTTSGHTYPVYNVDAILTINGSRPVEKEEGFFGYSMFRIGAHPIEIWNETGEFTMDSLKTRNGATVSVYKGLEWHKTIGGKSEIEIKNAFGGFELPIKKISSLVDAKKTKGKKNYSTEGSKYKLIVTGQDSGTFVGTVKSIQFARRPELGWTGTYTQWDWPLKWWRSYKLMVKDKDEVRRDIDFDKISKLEIKGFYVSTRSAVLTSTRGSKMECTIYPGDVAESHGVHTWDPYREGLYCVTTGGVEIYIPFSKGIAVNITPVASKGG